MAKELSEDDRDLPITGDGGNGLTKDVFRLHMRRLIEVNSARDEKLVLRKAARKQAKAAGIDLEKMDQIIEMLTWEPTEIREFMDTLLSYMDLAELLPSEDVEEAQLTLFPERDPTAQAKADWELRGFLAATTGKGTEGKPPAECPADRMQDWMEGWHRAQDANAPAKLAVVRKK